MAAEFEVRIVELRRAHPGVGARMMGYHLEKEEGRPVPSRSAIYRTLVRHQLLDPNARRKRRSDCRRCERDQAMELWQTDALGEVRLSESGSAGRVYDHFMARWVAPRSGVGRLIIQLVVLAVVVGGVYLLVLMLGSGLGGSTLQVSDARWG